MSVIVGHIPACPQVELKTQPRFCPGTSSFSMIAVLPVMHEKVL
jgi:hypothetical protein